MIKIRYLLAMSILFLLTTLSYAEAPVISDSEVIKQAITAYMNKHGTPGVAVTVFVDGKPQSYYYGYANLEKKSPVNQDTIFELGSISKVMTSILLAENIDLAKTQLDVPVRKYLPYLSKDFEEVTLETLATHTSGLAFDVPETIKTRKEFEQYLSAYYPDYIASEQWIYSNMGIGLLGEALEKLTRKNLNTLYRTELLAPLGMQPIGSEVPKTLQAHMAQGYTIDGQAAVSVNTGFFPAAGSVKASADDMRRFLAAAIGLPNTPEQLFYPIRMTQAAYVKLPAFEQGLGWQINSLQSANTAKLIPATGFNLGPISVETDTKQPVFNGDNLIGKTGSTKGFRAYIAVIPNKKTGIVILANKYDITPDMETTGRQILFALNHIKTSSQVVTPVTQ